ncbi:GNAT family N-acetyltransferase [Pseudoalteromonas phenolica]|uniref:GNAT family N-acetyltransferase n=1 Tax=Pseudoalteromonas phenolica TaxID=161398 RepID=UPI00110B817F|nr:GNAT family N-acetyltransferase [Pseudoalteromonas phenolica]TMO57989.1 GNAT family N-acetyltransferase [Pseudoalteromonas phenolica]
MEIKRVNYEDLTAITNLVEAVSKVAVLPYFNDQGKQEYIARVLPDIKMTLDNDNFVSVKAVSNDALLGFAAMRAGNYLTHLFVSHQAQRQGIGRKLLQHLLDSTDAQEIKLRSAVNSVDCYLKCGFEITDQEGEFNGIRFVPMSLIKSKSHKSIYKERACQAL